MDFTAGKKLFIKETNYIDFRKIADDEIHIIEDSISRLQELFLMQTNYIIDNIDKLSYAVFKENITKIPAEFPYQSSYYKMVVNKISKIKKDYVISLYKDIPNNRELILFAVEKDKSLIQKMEAITKSEKN